MFGSCKNTNNYDLFIAGIIIVLGALSAAYFYFAGNKIHYALLAILCVIVSVYWLSVRNNLNTFGYKPDTTGLDCNYIRVIDTLFFIFWSLSLLLWYNTNGTYMRPTLYFICIVVLVLFVVIELYYTKAHSRTYVLLIYAVLICLNLIWSQQLLFPGVIYNDPLAHDLITSEIIRTSHTITSDTIEYDKIPLFHILIAISSLVYDIPYKFATMLSVSLAHVIVITSFLFLICKKIYNNNVFSLLCVCIYLFSDYFIWMNYVTIPNTLAYCIFVTILYLLLFKGRRKGNDNAENGKLICLILLTLSLALTHHLSTWYLIFILILYLWISLISETIISRSIKVDYNTLMYLTFLIIIVFLIWNYYCGFMFVKFINYVKFGFDDEIFKYGSIPQVLREHISISPPLPELLYSSAGMYIILSIGLLGLLYCTKYYTYTKNGFYFGVIGYSLIFTLLGSSVLGLSIMSHRLYPLAYLFLSIPMGIAVYLNFFRKHYSFFSRFLSILIILIYTFVMITSATASVDYNTFSSSISLRWAITDAEWNAINTNLEIFDGLLYTDHYYSNYMNYMEMKKNSVDWPGDQSRRGMDNFNELITSSFNREKTYMIRDYVTDNPVPMHRGYIRLSYDPKIALENSGFIKVYDSRSVSTYAYR